MKEFKDMKEMFTKIVNLQDDVKNNLSNYIERENIGVNNYVEKLSDKYNEVADYIFDELNQEESENMMYLSGNMENLDGDAQIISAFVKAYITDQIIIETVSFEELAESLDGKKLLEFDIPFNDEESVKKLNDAYPDMIEPFKTMEEHVLEMFAKIKDTIHEVGDKGGWYMGDGIEVKVEIKYDEVNK